MEVVRLAARTDFRLEKLSGQPVWHVPADDAADGRARACLAAPHRRPCRRARRTSTVKGRMLRVPRAAMGVARFSFHDLCEQPLGGRRLSARSRTSSTRWCSTTSR